MGRYYENYFEDDWPIPSQFDVAAFSSGLKAKCRESYERRSGMEYEEGSYNECDFGNLYAAQATKRANEAAGTANTAFIGSSPPINQFSPSKLTIKPSGPSSGPFLPGGGMTSLLSPSIHILALLLATAIALYNHRELARYILYWLARAAGIDLAAWPSTIHLLPTALRDITPNLPHATTTTTPTTPTISRTPTTTRPRPPHYWTTLHALRLQEGLTAPALTALQACYLLTLLLLICICPTGVAEAVISSTWSGLVWPATQVYLLVVVITAGVRWGLEVVGWVVREVGWFGVWVVGEAVRRLVVRWVGVVRGCWRVVFVVGAGWVSWGLVRELDGGAVAQGTAGWVLWRGAELLYWAGDVVTDVARLVMLRG